MYDQSWRIIKDSWNITCNKQYNRIWMYWQRSGDPMPETIPTGGGQWGCSVMRDDINDS